MDRGFYHVKAINTEGEAKCSALINVTPQMILPEPMIVESSGYPPEFLQLFNDRKATVGGNVTFAARVTGTQPLKVNSPFPNRNNRFCPFILGLLVI